VIHHQGDGYFLANSLFEAAPQFDGRGIEPAKAA